MNPIYTRVLLYLKAMPDTPIKEYWTWESPLQIQAEIKTREKNTKQQYCLDLRDEKNQPVIIEQCPLQMRRSPSSPLICSKTYYFGCGIRKWGHILCPAGNRMNSFDHRGCSAYIEFREYQQIEAAMTHFFIE